MWTAALASLLLLTAATQISDDTMTQIQTVLKGLAAIAEQSGPGAGFVGAWYTAPSGVRTGLELHVNMSESPIINGGQLVGGYVWPDGTNWAGKVGGIFRNGTFKPGGSLEIEGGFQ